MVFRGYSGSYLRGIQTNLHLIYKGRDMPALLYFLAVVLLVVNLLTADNRIYLNPVDRRSLSRYDDTSRNELTRDKTKIELVCEDGSTALLVPDWEADTNYQYVCPYKKPKGGLYYMTLTVFGLAIITDYCRKCKEVMSKGLSSVRLLLQEIAEPIQKIGELAYANKVYIQLTGAIILIIWQHTTWW